MGSGAGGPAVLMELGMVEQRYQAVLAVLGGASVTKVARRESPGRRSMTGCAGMPVVGQRAG